jgi:signal transduction histidine kinase
MPASLLHAAQRFGHGSIALSKVEFSTLVQFSKLVSDSPTSEGVFSLLARTVVEKCSATHALVFGTTDDGDFRVLSSYGGCDPGDVRALELEGVCTVADLRAVIIKRCGDRGYEILNKTYQHQKLQKAFDDLRISQDTLIRTEKFRALGQMSAGIAHDLKNILNPLLLYTDVIRDAAGNRDEVLEVVDRIERILNRGLQTVERLRDFSRQSPEETEAVPTELNAMARESIEISKPRLSGLEVAVDLGNPPKVLIRPADCVSAVVNLILNSADALAGKGKLRNSTGASDGGAWIEVADNGPGIPPEIKSKVLEPFFTTKGEAGTGLGLSIVYAFTQRHGGRLQIDSEPGQGVRSRMWFPAIS